MKLLIAVALASALACQDVPAGFGDADSYSPPNSSNIGDPSITPSIQAGDSFPDLQTQFQNRNRILRDTTAFPRLRLCPTTEEDMQQLEREDPAQAALCREQQRTRQ